MQILDIILYSKSGEQRVLPFDLGKVNIITGDSKTGKTAIIDIVDYCLGSDFNIKEGVVRDYVWWYAVRYQLKHGQILVARPNPMKYSMSGSDVFFLQGDRVHIPVFSELVKNINVDSLLIKLANIVGIDEYTHQVETFSRPETPVTFKHSRFYSFQPQPDIDQPGHLFYHQTKEDGRVAQAMKDTLPYFLGAIETESIKLERQLADKKRNLNRLERELKDAQTIVNKTMGQVFDLVNEAKQVGLVQIDEVPKDREEGLVILQTVSALDILQENPDAENEVLISLQSQRVVINNELDSIRQSIKATEDYQKETQGYESEVGYQALRLESINIYPKNKVVNNSICPLCSQELETKIPKIELIEQSLLALQANLEITQKERPKLKQYLDSLYKEQNDLKRQIQEIEKAISVIFRENEQAKRLKDLNIRKGRVLGRISLYLESKTEVSDFSETKQKIALLKSEIEALQKQLSAEDKEDKLEGILDQLSLQMTSWAKELELEFKERTIKFDIKKLTLFIISTDKPKIRFDQTGSGENWVAYHLLIHFALHKYFILNTRPTPNFLILDQMSQAYFPPEKDLRGTGEVEQSEDDLAIKRFFDFVFNRTEELEGKMQTIIIDHAKLKDEKFEAAIKEEWRKGIKLVPIEWTNQ